MCLLACSGLMFKVTPPITLLLNPLPSRLLLVIHSGTFSCFLFYLHLITITFISSFIHPLSFTLLFFNLLRELESSFTMGQRIGRSTINWLLVTQWRRYVTLFLFLLLLHPSLLPFPPLSFHSLAALFFQITLIQSNL